MPKPKKTALSAESAADWVAIGDLRPWKDNPRKNDGAPVDKVAESIKRFGFGAPILARRANGEIIAGHTRWKAAQKLGLDRVPVRFLELDPADAHLLALADNRVAEEASWDEDMLAAVIADLKAADADLGATGFTDGEIDKLLAEALAPAGDGSDAPEAEPSRADELQAKWKTEPSQLWEIPSRAAVGKSHRILCADSTKAEDVAQLMGDERADCQWCDPPYGVAYVGKTKAKLTIANDKLTGEKLFDFLAACFVAADTHALKPGAAIYIAHPSGVLSIQFLLAVEHAGWRIHQGLVWVKDQFVLGHSDYHLAHEPLILAYSPAKGRRGRGGDGWYGDNAQASTFDIPRPRSSQDHPTMKPVELVAAMIRNSAPVAGLVYEPFSGSGSTMAACEATGRVCRAIEIDPKYVAVALERMSAMGLEPKLAA